MGQPYFAITLIILFVVSATIKVIGRVIKKRRRAMKNKTQIISNSLLEALYDISLTIASGAFLAKTL